MEPTTSRRHPISSAVGRCDEGLCLRYDGEGLFSLSRRLIPCCGFRPIWPYVPTSDDECATGAPTAHNGVELGMEPMINQMGSQSAVGLQQPKALSVRPMHQVLSVLFHRLRGRCRCEVSGSERGTWPPFGFISALSQFGEDHW